MMISRVAPLFLLSALAVTPSVWAHPAWAQGAGARAGNAVVPSTHSPGCAGLLCDSDDPRRAEGAPPPPPCEGLLCGMSPYGMARPVTASEAARLQEERTRAEAAAAATPPPAKPEKKSKRHSAKAKSGAAVARRTPDPVSAAPAPQ